MYRRIRAGLVVLLATGSLAIAGCGGPEYGSTDETSTAGATVERDWDYEIAYQRGIEAVNWATPAVSMVRYREAHFGLGGGLNTVYYLSQPPTPVTDALTANNQTPYSTVLMSTRDGPVVLDIPPASDRAAIFGSAVDIWQVPVADFGPAGTDQGMGGRYLFLPPGYDDPVPEDYFVVPMDTYNVLVALRLIPLGGAGFEETAEYAMNIRAYPLSEADSPPAGEYIDIAGKRVPTLVVYDVSLYEDIVTVLDEEPLLERDKVMGGMLASIGIERGKAFDPQGTTRDALEQAVHDAKEYLDFLFDTPGYAFENRWPDRQWMDIRLPSEDGFVFDEGDYLLLDARAAVFHFATFAPRRLGSATANIVATRDSGGALFSGDGSYSLTVPADVPARDFWSVIAYSFDTKAFIYNDLDRVGFSSYDMSSMAVNEDGSVDLHFGATPPEGLESNWIPTAGEDFFIMFRFYGPQDAFFDKSWVLADVVRND